MTTLLLSTKFDHPHDQLLQLLPHAVHLDPQGLITQPIYLQFWKFKSLLLSTYSQQPFQMLYDVPDSSQEPPSYPRLQPAELCQIKSDFENSKAYHKVLQVGVLGDMELPERSQEHH